MSDRFPSVNRSAARRPASWAVSLLTPGGLFDGRGASELAAHWEDSLS